MATTNDSWSNVGDGETNTHTTDSNINLQSAQIRWTGNTVQNKTVTKQDTLYDTVEKNGNGGTINQTWTDETAPPDPTNQTGYQRTVRVGSRTTVYDTEAFIDVSGSASVTTSYDDVSVSDSTGASEIIAETSIDFDDPDATALPADHAADATSEGDGQNAQATLESWTTYEYETQEDVDADISTTVNGGGTYSVNSLGGGQTSSWRDITSDFVVGENNFSHSINDGPIELFELEYTYTVDGPVAQDHFRIHVNGNTYQVPLASTDDSALVTTSVRVAKNGNVYAVVLVDPTDSNATEARVYANGTTYALGDSNSAN